MPARPLAEYARFELRDITAQAQVHPKVMTKFTTELKLRIDESLGRWNAEGDKPGHAGTLAIEVVITEMKFVSGAKRFWAGALAGGSRSVAITRLIDVDSGQVLYTQEFREQANSVAGAYSIGASDNAMIDRLAAGIATWVIAHHDRAPLQADALQSTAS
jgi:hypothetical protein